MTPPTDAPASPAPPMTAYQLSTVPARGKRIEYSGGKLLVPDTPIIPFIEGDGTGPDIWRASVRVFDAAVEKAYKGKRRIAWMEVFAGEKAFNQFKTWLPQETVDACNEFRVSIKGPLTTPVGGGIRSLNVTLRQVLDLYACIRPVRYFKGVGAPVKDPQSVDIVIFRENTEDVYSGIEWKAGSKEAEDVADYLRKNYNVQIREHSAIGVKPMSEFGSKRLVRMAIQHAIRHKRPSVTLVHKGNIMKFTEGAFREWGYQVARDEFGDRTITEDEATKNPEAARGKVIIKDRIADAMFQMLLLRPNDYAVLATPNLTGDYLSDAAAAQVGGLGIAPGGNVGDGVACFEATHGTAPKYAGQDKVNPGSVILSGVMMLEYLGWDEAAELIVRGLERAIEAGQVTYDLARQMPGSTQVATSRFADQIISRM